MTISANFKKLIQYLHVSEQRFNLKTQFHYNSEFSDYLCNDIKTVGLYMKINGE